MKDRHVGLEQELFLVDEEGVLSNRADEFLGRCHELAEAGGQDPDHFAPECARSLVEVSTPPAASVDSLADEYLANLRLALRAARDLGLRLYPLATYPLPVVPDMRDELHYRIQSYTMGREKFLHAGRCAGVHLHLEVAPETIDPRIGVSYEAPVTAREELLNVYNLVTALDPATIALTRSTPFYEGELQDVTARTAYYRGSPDFAPFGLYANLAAVGGLRPYAEETEDLVGLQFSRYREWLAAMDRAGVGRQLFEEAGDGLLEAAWNPVRLNPHGTVELRGLDGVGEKLPHSRPGHGPSNNRRGRTSLRRRPGRKAYGRGGNPGGRRSFLEGPGPGVRRGETLPGSGNIRGGEPGGKCVFGLYLRVRGGNSDLPVLPQVQRAPNA